MNRGSNICLQSQRLGGSGRRIQQQETSLGCKVSSRAVQAIQQDDIVEWFSFIHVSATLLSTYLLTSYLKKSRKDFFPSIFSTAGFVYLLGGYFYYVLFLELWIHIEFHLTCHDLSCFLPHTFSSLCSLKYGKCSVNLSWHLLILRPQPLHLYPSVTNSISWLYRLRGFVKFFVGRIFWEENAYRLHSDSKNRNHQNFP